MALSLRYVVMGFIAAAIAVVLVHQSIVFLLNTAGIWDKAPWSTAPTGPWGVPSILNSIFWGGLWGAVLALAFNTLPGTATWLKGLFFGWMIFLVSNCVVLPLIKGQPLFYSFDPAKLLSVFLILSGFGIATALIYERLRG